MEAYGSFKKVVFETVYPSCNMAREDGSFCLILVFSMETTTQLQHRSCWKCTPGMVHDVGDICASTLPDIYRAIVRKLSGVCWGRGRECGFLDWSPWQPTSPRSEDLAYFRRKYSRDERPEVYESASLSQ